MIVQIDVDGDLYWKLGAVAEQTGMRISDVMTIAAREHVDSNDVENVRLPAQAERAMCVLFHAGWSDGEIGRVLGFARGTIGNRRRLLGLVRSTNGGRPSSLDLERKSA